MTKAILDCSVVAGWFFDDEASPASQQLLLTVRREGAVVPVHWPLEVANMLIHAERGGRIRISTVDDRLALMRQLPIAIEPALAETVWGRTLMIARQDRLTSYDAAYLELALRLGLPLATKDKALARAAARHGVTHISV